VGEIHRKTAEFPQNNQHDKDTRHEERRREHSNLSKYLFCDGVLGPQAPDVHAPTRREVL
jgi:hypothetical protein